MQTGGGGGDKEKEDDDVDRDQQYYTDLLKSLRDDSVRPSSPLAYEIGRPDRRPRVKQPYEDDPASPYRFMHGVKFMIWNSAGVTIRMNQATTNNLDQEQQKLLTKSMREETRLNFLCEREAKASNRFIDTKKEMRVLLEQLKPASTKLDRMVEQDLLKPYRKNGDNYQRLMSRVEEVQQIRQQQHDEVKHRPRPKTANISAAERREQVLKRRDTHLTEQQELISTLALEKQLRSEKHSEGFVSASNNRARKWLTIVNTLTHLDWMYKTVLETRNMKEKNIVRWKAAKKIQKLWAWYTKKHRPKEASGDSILKASHQQDAHSTYQNRVNSSDMITNFLRDTRYRALTRRFFRDLRFVQGEVRMHFAINQARVLLLTKLIDTCLSALSYHISVILSNKGLDLKNIPSMELAQLKGYGFVGLKQFRILKEMQTVKFHAFLRKYTAKLQDFHRDFIAPTTKLWVEGTHADIKESLLKQYLFRKRRAFLDKLTQHDVLTFEVPTVTLEEVHEFIKEQDNDQKDPLRHHLIEVENKVDHYYRTRNLPKWPFRRNKEQEATGEFACPLLLLLHSFHPEDMLLILLSFSEAVKAQQHAHNNPDHGSSNKHSNKKEKYHKLYDHAPGIDPHAGHNLGKSSIDPSTLGHGSSHYNNLGGSRGFSGSGSFNNSSRSTVLDNANQHRHRPSGANFLGSSGINMNSSNAAYSSPKRPTKVRDNLEFSGSLSSSRPSAPMGSMKSPNARASHRTTNLSMSSSISPRKL